MARYVHRVLLKPEQKSSLSLSVHTHTGISLDPTQYPRSRLDRILRNHFTTGILEPMWREFETRGSIRYFIVGREERCTILAAGYDFEEVRYDIQQVLKRLCGCMHEG